ncbi:MAG TPA: cation:proton antiporter [Candidatus Akkermansia intestinigallinarum]|uniref:Cation:proton antiporter n=1 Tax=Candidatus Akkermansia intestinigallinarum TaxID=2838431 RepID=A0A9D1VCZ9_9BACT|nr:cation:proton antiporter [Candidatus Akkermansia intestinigallinarum]
MINTLAISLTLALVLGMLSQKVRLSPIIGYLLAGIIAAQCWGDSLDHELVEDFSHIGVVLLLFGVGLQFHFKDLVAVQKVAVPGAIMCMGMRTLLGTLTCMLLGGAMGFTMTGCVMFGLCCCVSSTVVLTRVLADNRILQTPSGHLALGMLVVEDIFTIVLLVLMPVIFGDKPLLESLLWMVVKLGLLVLCVAYVGRRIIGRVLTYVSRFASGELFTLAVLVFALGIASLSAYVFDASMEFGAFLSGMVVGQSKFSARAASDALPMRDAFAVLFFVSVGMGFHWEGMIEYWPMALGTVLLTLLAPIAAYIAIRMLKRPFRMAMQVSASLSQLGEFSFILATLASTQYDVLPREAANIITGAAIITITLNAAFYRFVPALIRAMEKRGVGDPRHEELDNVPEPQEDRHRVIVVGYGPCGELCTKALLDNDVDVVVIEMNVNTVQRLMKCGIPAMHGDAARRDILKLAGVEQAVSIIITTPAAPAADIASMARSLNPKIQVLAHTAYLSVAEALKRSLKDDVEVFSGEHEVALTMFAHLLRSQHATEEQISRELERTRNELTGGRPTAEA